jgi:hypothetical protein
MTDSPTFVAYFADGEITRMTTWCELGKLDVARGIRLAQHAYRSRMGQKPPAIKSARFEDSEGGVLEKYDAGSLVGTFGIPSKAVAS